jgi:hypothetical protein
VRRIILVVFWELQYAGKGKESKHLFVMICLRKAFKTRHPTASCRVVPLRVAQIPVIELRRVHECVGTAYGLVVRSKVVAIAEVVSKDSDASSEEKVE